MANLAKNIRNVALVGHGGEGKTTLAEAILFNAKAIDRQGNTNDGNTVMDFDSEEIAKKISISLAVANCSYQCEFGMAKFNLLDTPGFFDFEGEMRLALDAADSAIVVSGLGGSVSVGTEKALDYALKTAFLQFCSSTAQIKTMQTISAHSTLLKKNIQQKLHRWKFLSCKTKK